MPTAKRKRGEALRNAIRAEIDAVLGNTPAFLKNAVLPKSNLRSPDADAQLRAWEMGKNHGEKGRHAAKATNLLRHQEATRRLEDILAPYASKLSLRGISKIIAFENNIPLRTAQSYVQRLKKMRKAS